MELESVVGKAALMYATALLGLHPGERRTLAQWSIIDFVTAVAIGAIVGRTAIAGSQSFITGAAVLLTLIVMHRLASGTCSMKPPADSQSYGRTPNLRPSLSRPRSRVRSASAGSDREQ